MLVRVVVVVRKAGEAVVLVMAQPRHVALHGDGPQRVLGKALRLYCLWAAQGEGAAAGRHVTREGQMGRRRIA